MPALSSLASRLILQAILACGLPGVLSFQARATDPGAAGIPLQSGKMSDEGFYEFSFSAENDQTYPVAVSPDLLRWTFLTNVIGRGRPLHFEDRSASNFQRRFYHIGVPDFQPIPVSNMVFIQPGTFTMGSPDSESGRESREGPQRIVTISRGYWIARYEVTQQEYVALMGTNVAFYAFDLRLPLDFATWFNATNYCSRLTETERAAGRLPLGYQYRLPTEAEWEYACRAGTTTPFGVGTGVSLSSTQANFDGTFPYGGAPSGQYLQITRPGGAYAPNAWELFDMHGNVWEWCQDWYGPYTGGNVTDPKGPATGTTRVLRGGGYTSVGQGCRSAKRDSRAPTYANTIQGFRIVLAQDP